MDPCCVEVILEDGTVTNVTISPGNTSVNIGSTTNSNIVQLQGNTVVTQTNPNNNVVSVGQAGPPGQQGVPGPAGSVISVGLSMPSQFTVTGSPITTSGVLNVTFASGNPNLFLATPSGTAGFPTFRGITTADLNISGINGVQVAKTDTAYVISATGLGTLSSVGLSTPAELIVNNSPLTGSGGTISVTKANQNPNNVWAGPTTGGAAQPGFRGLVPADIPFIANGSNINVTYTGSNIIITNTMIAGTVTSVDLSMPAEFTVSNNPVTGAGTLTVTKANENANTAWLGPTFGAASVPTFRAIQGQDLSTIIGASGIQVSLVGNNLVITASALGAGGGSGSVTSVGLSAPGEFTISGSPVTSTGTLTFTKATQSANTAWLGPTSGAAAQPTFRGIQGQDLSTILGASGIQVSLVGNNLLISASNVLTQLSVPAEFSYSESVQSDGTTLGIISKATESVNTSWMGPTSGGPAVPTFRAIQAADLSAITGGAGVQIATVGSNLVISSSGASGGGSGTVTSVGLAMPNIFNVTNSPITTSGTLTATLTNEYIDTFFAGPLNNNNTTIPVGSQPVAMALMINNASGFVCNNGVTTVTPINLANNLPGSPITVGGAPTAIALMNNNASGFVCIGSGANVTPINLSNGIAGANISLSINPLGIALMTNNASGFVCGFGGIVSINLANGKAGSLISSPSNNLVAIALMSNNASGFACSSVLNTVVPLNLANNTIGTPIAVGTTPNSLVITPDNTKVYVCNSGTTTVSVISTVNNTVTNTITVGTSPKSLAITPDGTKVYVCNNGSSTVSVISTASNTVINTITVGNSPIGISVTASGNYVFVTNSSDNTVSVISTNTQAVVAVVGVGNTPNFSVSGTSINIDSAYICNHSSSNTVSFIEVAATPTFRAIQGQDLNTIIAGNNIQVNLSGNNLLISSSGTVSSVIGASGISAIQSGSNLVISASNMITGVNVVPVEFNSTESVKSDGTQLVTITKAVENANTSWMGPTSGAAAQPTFRAIQGQDLSTIIGASGIQVSLQGNNLLISASNDISTVVVPVEFSVTNTYKTATITKANENANTVWAGPTTGGAAQPGFRGLVGQDLITAIAGASGIQVNLVGNTLTVTSTATITQIAVPAEFSVALGPVYSSGTQLATISKTNEAANTAWLGPTSGGASVPTFRAIQGQDLSNVLGANGIQSSLVGNTLVLSCSSLFNGATLPTFSASSMVGVNPLGTAYTGYQLTGTGGVTITYSASSINIGVSSLAGGTVTSVGLAAPPEFTVSGSPISGAGTLTFTKANELANTAWLGPTSGAAAQPTFRPIQAADLTSLIGASGITLTTSGSNLVITGPINQAVAPNVAFYSAPNVISGDPAANLNSGQLTLGTNTLTGSVVLNPGGSGFIVGCPITVGSQPVAIALMSNNASGFVCNEGNGTVTPINLANGVAGTNITVGSEPMAIALMSNNASGFVCNFNSSSVTPINLVNGKTGTAIAVGTNPTAIALMNNNASGFVVSSTSLNITPINLANGKAGTAISTPNSPISIALMNNNASGFVGTANGVTVINLANGNTNTISLDGNNTAIALMSNNASGFSAISNPFNEVLPINIATNVAGSYIPVGTSPVAIAITPDNSKVYVVNKGSNNVSVISTASNTVIATIPVMKSPSAVVITNDSLNVIISSTSSNTISIISTTTNTVVQTLYVGNATSVGVTLVSLAIDSLNNVYSVNGSSSTVSPLIYNGVQTVLSSNPTFNPAIEVNNLDGLGGGGQNFNPPPTSGTFGPGVYQINGNWTTTGPITINSPVWIYCNGTATISAGKAITVNQELNGGLGGAAAAAGDIPQPGQGLGGGQPGKADLNSGGGGGGFGGNGGNGGGSLGGFGVGGNDYYFLRQGCGSGGGGAGTATTTPGTMGGAGGGSFYLEASVAINVNANISAVGGPGVNTAVTSVPCGGGGSGGLIDLRSPNTTIVAGVTLDVSGGAGGTSSAVTAGDGGGGGSGGYINIPYAINGGTATVAGGAAGTGSANGVAGSSGVVNTLGFYGPSRP